MINHERSGAACHAGGKITQTKYDVPKSWFLLELIIETPGAAGIGLDINANYRQVNNIDLPPRQKVFVCPAGVRSGRMA